MTGECTVDRKRLAVALQLAGLVTGRAVPVTRCVRLAGTAHGLTVEATDGAARIALAVPRLGIPGGAGELLAVVSPRTLLAAMRLRPAAEEVSLRRREGSEDLEVFMGADTLARLPSLPLDTWFAAETVEATASFGADAGTLRAALVSVACAASDAEERSNLAVIHLRREAGQGTCTLSATDGRRLHRAWLSSEDAMRHVERDGHEYQEDTEALLHAGDAPRLAEFLATAAAAAGSDAEECVAEGDLVVLVSAARVVLDATVWGATQRLVLRQPESQFPNVDQVLPDPALPQLRVTIEASEAHAALRAVRSLEAADERKAQTCRLKISADLTALHIETGPGAAPAAYATTALACSATQAGDVSSVPGEITLDARFAEEMLQAAAAAGGRCTLVLRSDGQPLSLECEPALAVVMPMRA